MVAHVLNRQSNNFNYLWFILILCSFILREYKMLDLELCSIGDFSLIAQI